MSSLLSAVEYERTAAVLRGRRIHRVVYYPLMGGKGGCDVEEWDFGAWHQPTMGVELFTDDGGCFSAVWGSSFDRYGLEVFPVPMTAQLRMIGEPGGSAAVDVTDHPRWSSLVGRELTCVDIAWCQDSEGGLRRPDAIRLCSLEKVVWIAAARPAEWPPAEVYHLGTDDVMVVFTAEFAAKVGIPSVG
ncbi:hypothetical protein LDL08_13070 [Nonomuraea glycinis]|uniref:Uncharacterized protein n=1 Tax=Nonomuraea glycinis TaxID=2047744 RepID=A0A918E2D6_9ACTN|nr:hypothetical protein [Nonomuraea glycinis]MCA2177113.1 hypothetical protein [Nonomuraea glycinis]GGP02645.1 hypothetical protein GCM10012278_10650 [Nonomuraea glycinis]